MTLTFNERNHTYRCDGKPIPGVTTLLGKGLPKPALPNWAAKTVAEYVVGNLDTVHTMIDSGGDGPTIDFLKRTPWQARDTAAIRGTDIHAIAEDLVHGKEVEVPEHLLEPVNGYVKWLDAWNPTVEWTERPVANRADWYAGKPDVVCMIGADRWLLDWKSAKGVYGDNALQVSAYGHAEFYVDENGDEQAMPHIDRYGVVHVRPDGTDLYEVTDADAAWRYFRHVAYVAKNTDNIRGLIASPSEAPEGVTAA